MSVHKSLLSRIRDVREKALASRAHDRRQEEIKQIRQYIKNLIELKGELYSFYEVYGELYPIHALPEDINHSVWCKVRDEYSLVNDAIDKPGTDWSRNNRNIRNITKRIQDYRKEINGAWKAYCQESIKGNVAIVDTLGRIYADCEIKLINELVDEKKAIMSSGPEDAGKVQQQISFYDDKCHELLAMLDLNDKIIVFLRRLTSEGQRMYLSDMDDEILSWLKENHFANKLEVKFC